MKTGDKIYLAIGNRISVCRMVDFRCYCTEVQIGGERIRTVRYCRGRFYGFGYDSDGARVLFLKKLWHYYPAVWCEKMRQILSFFFKTIISTFVF